MQTRVKLVSYTQHPLETLYKVWMENRDPNLHLEVEDLVTQRKTDTTLDADIKRIFKALISSDISVIQNIHFTFKLENISIALREQLVRHRIGVAWDARLGVDYIPDLTDDGIWIQSMRVLDMSKFYTDEKYEFPREVADSHNAAVIYKSVIQYAQEAYSMLCKMGVPRETARMVIPLAAQHDMFWTLNLGALCHILRKRGCWIPQFGLWAPIIVGMVDALATQVHPVFRELTQPPCVKNGKFTGCHFPEDIARRLDHSDPLPPCPIACNHKQIEQWGANVGTVVTVTDADRKTFSDMQCNYQKLWGYASLEELESKED